MITSRVMPALLPHRRVANPPKPSAPTTLPGPWASPWASLARIARRGEFASAAKVSSSRSSTKVADAATILFT